MLSNICVRVFCCCETAVLLCLSKELINCLVWGFVRGHPFNLKRGGGGAIVFFGVQIFAFASEHSRRKKIPTTCRYIIFFLQKLYFLRHKVLTEYFFLSISQTEKFCQSNLQTEKKIPKKNHSPPFKFNGKKINIQHFQLILVMQT